MGSPDIVVVGGGPAGYVNAIRFGQLGRRVVLVERERIGGTCLNWGCIPVKALLHSAAIVRGAAEARRMGIRYGPPEIDILALYAYKSRIVDRLVRGVEFLLKANDVELVRGEARFTGPRRISVKTVKGEAELAAETVVIATGSKPVFPSGFEPDEKSVIDSDGALRLVQLPGRIAIIGAGVVGLEFATIFSRLGTRVTVLELLERALPGIDADVAASLQKTMAREGVEFRFGVRVEEIERSQPVRVRYSDGTGVGEVEADQVLVSIGRIARTDGLEPAAAGVKLDRSGFVKVDSGYRTSAEGVFAIGDVVGGQLLAHKAMAEGLSLAEQVAGNGKGWKFRAVPACVYTDPEVAMVGVTEDEARSRELDVRTSRVPLSAIGRALTLGRNEGFGKLIVDARTDKVLGAGIVAPQADVLISEAALAVELGLTADKLGRVVHPHPTMSELLFEAAEAVHGRAIHVVNPRP